MVNYAQYFQNIQNPAQSVIQGYSQGLQIQGQQNQIQAQQEQRGFAQQDAMRKQQEFAQKQQLAQQKQQNIAEFIGKKAKTAEDYANFGVTNPELIKQTKQAYDLLGTEKQQNMTRSSYQVLAAIKSGNVDLAQDMIGKQAKISEESGDDRQAAFWKSQASMIKANPDAAETIMGVALSSVDDGFADNYSKLGQEQRDQELQPFEINAQRQQAINAMKEADLTSAQISKTLAEAKRAGRSPMEIAREKGLIAQAQAPYKSKGLEIRTADGTIISQGGSGQGIDQDLTKPVVTELQKDIAGLSKNVADLDIIAESYNPEFNTFQYKAENAANKFFDRFGTPLDKSKIGEYKKYQNNVKQFFNAYKKEITGSAAAVQEIQDLRESLFDIDSSPTEFEAGLKQVQDTVKRHLRIKRKLLREGVSGKKLNQQFDNAIKQGIDDNPRDRALELKKQGGITPKEVREMLIKEGYTFT